MLHSLLLLVVLQSAQLASPQPLARLEENSDNVNLELALAAIRPTSLRADLGFLASDEMRGRDTPSPELELAALYLRSRIQRLGFQPGAKDGWFHEYPLFRSYLDGSESFIEISSAKGSGRLIFGQDYFFILSSHAVDSSLRAGVVCVGGGSKDEVAAADLEGRWALVLDTGRVLRKAIERCQEAGALGVIATPGPKYKRDSYDEKFAKRASQMLEGSKPSIKARKSVELLPQVMLTREAATQLFELSTSPWEGEFPPLGHDLGLEITEERDAVDEEIMVSNVCAFWPGSDPELSKEVMIISAHYDHVGERRGQIYNGADDNASGTTGLLGVADALRAYGPMKRSVLLLWVSGEEKGLWGSRAWTKDPWLPEGCTPVLDINIDMIGRTETDELYITPSREHDAFNSLAGAAYSLAEVEGFAELQSQDQYWRRSDHMNFHDNLEIPVTFLSTGEHPDYHRPTDTYEKIDYEKMSRIVRLVVRLLDNVQAAELTR
jgi:hypothetical protein